VIFIAVSLKVKCVHGNYNEPVFLLGHDGSDLLHRIIPPIPLSLKLKIEPIEKKPSLSRLPPTNPYSFAHILFPGASLPHALERVRREDDRLGRWYLLTHR
jgi:hypothetical protein